MIAHVLAPLVSCVIGSGNTPYSHCEFEVMLSFEVRKIAQASILLTVQSAIPFSWSKLERSKGEEPFVAALTFDAAKVLSSCA